MKAAVRETQRRLDRVVVVGTSCSGKSTFARELARIIGSSPFDLDDLHWGPNWTPQPKEEFHRLLVEAAAGDRWVAAGNYSPVRDLLWPRATTVVWLNYPFATVCWRAIRRTVGRILMREVVCGGNRETFRLSFLSRDSILLWVVKTFHRRRRETEAIRTDQTYPHLEWIEFRRPRDAQRFLQELSNMR